MDQGDERRVTVKRSRHGDFELRYVSRRGRAQSGFFLAVAAQVVALFLAAPLGVGAASTSLEPGAEVSTPESGDANPG